MLKWVLATAVAAAVTLSNMDSGIANEIRPVLGWNEQLFPSYIISTAKMKRYDESVAVEEPEAESSEDAEVLEESSEETEATETDATEEEAEVEFEEAAPVPEVIGDPYGLLGAQLVSPGDNVSVKVTVSCDEIMEPSIFTGTLPEKDVLYQVLPRIRYRYTKLAEITQVTPVSMTIKVQIGKATPVELTETVIVRPINDCPLAVNYDGYIDDVSYTFAAYVNEQHPFLDKVLREALDNGVVDSFYGYQGQDADVIRQVYAIWDTLVSRDVRYSNITNTSATADMVLSQHVRLIEESLNNSQANCVDGSVLFASMLRKIGIEPFLVIIPGHCYVGFYVDQERQKLLAIETTLLGRSFQEGEEFQTLEVLNNAVSEELRDPASWPSFATAIVAGTSNIVENAEKLESRQEGQYLLIEITDCRQRGILPIAYRGRTRFEDRNSEDYASANDEE